MGHFRFHTSLHFVILTLFASEGKTQPHFFDNPTYMNDLVNFINDGLNKSVQPCDDFYGYVCSNHSQSSHDLLMKHFFQLIRPIIETDEKYPEVSSALLNFVDGCSTYRQNITEQEVLWRNHLEKYYRDFSTESDKKWNFWKGLLRIAFIAPLGIEFDYYSDINHMNSFQSEIDKLIFFSSNTYSAIDSVFEKSWSLYSSIYSEEEKESNFIAEKQNVVEFSQKYQQIIKKFIHSFSENITIQPLHNIRNQNLRAAVNDLFPYYIDEYISILGLRVQVDEEMIEEISHLFIENQRAGKRFIQVLAIASLMKYLPKKELETHQCFFIAIQNTTYSPIFNLYLSDLVIRHRVQMTTVDDQLLVRNLIESIRQSIRNRFINTIWLKNNRELLENIDDLMNLSQIVGFREVIYKENNETIAELNHFSLSTEATFLDVVERLQMTKRRLSDKLEKSYIADFEINTANMKTFIEINFSILQHPFFNHHFPDSYSFGFSGVTIGHEFFHSFAPYFVPERYYKHPEYNKSLDCYEQFYSENMCYNLTIEANKTTETICADGQNDIEENIPDVEGARAAFDAMKAKLGNESQLKIKPLPGNFNFTNEQLFFVAFANSKCEKRFNDHEFFAEFLRNRKDTHAPHNVRVNAVAMQMNEFAKAFGCQATDRMVTKEEEKCYLLPSSG